MFIYIRKKYSFISSLDKSEKTNFHIYKPLSNRNILLIIILLWEMDLINVNRNLMSSDWIIKKVVFIEF